MTQQSTPPRARHLMDPNAPRRPASAAEIARLQRVQRWVMSVLVSTTILHLAVGLLVAALFIDDAERVSQVGLCVLAAAFGVCAVAAAFGIHRRPILTPWLLVGLAPGLFGLLLVLN